jgi:tetratricopeptide (TPR) repeat protein
MAEALFSLASAMSAEQSMTSALIYAQLALALKPEFPVAQVLLGEIYEDTEHYAKAIEAFESIPEDSPLRPSAEIQIATNLDRLERFDEALERLDRLIADRPDYFDALVARGNLMRLHEKWTEAAESYSRAIDVIGTPEREHWTVVYFRGIAYERAGNGTSPRLTFAKHSGSSLIILRFSTTSAIR